MIKPVWSVMQCMYNAQNQQQAGVLQSCIGNGDAAYELAIETLLAAAAAAAAD